MLCCQLLDILNKMWSCPKLITKAPPEISIEQLDKHFIKLNCKRANELKRQTEKMCQTAGLSFVGDSKFLCFLSKIYDCLLQCICSLCVSLNLCKSIICRECFIKICKNEYQLSALLGTQACKVTKQLFMQMNLSLQSDERPVKSKH